MGKELIKVEPINTEQAHTELPIALQALSDAKALVIENQAELESAAFVLKRIKGGMKNLTTICKGITRPIDEAKSRVLDLFGKPLNFYKQAEEAIKQAILNYTTAQERIREKKEEALRVEAEEKERRRVAALQRRADIAREKGKEEKAESLEAQKEEEVAPPPMLAPTTEKVKGVHYVEKWTGEVVDFAKLPDEYKLPNMPMINRVAQATKGQVPIPGVKITSEKIVASRAK